MASMFKRGMIVWIGLALCSPLPGQSAAGGCESALLRELRAIPGLADVKVLLPDGAGFESYELSLIQPLDHGHPQAGEFRQRLLLSHVDSRRPMVMIIEGYEAGKNFIGEARRYLRGNELRIEHRFFGASAPAVPDWKYLNAKQAVADCHRIAALFKKIYPGTWLSAGWSKGGETALLHRRSHPGDVAATIAYDAPINFALEDPRIDAFFDKVGTPECRQKLIRFQRMVLERKKEILPRFDWYARGRRYSFSVGVEKALEYCVLEYPFSFWQYTDADCGKIPAEPSTPDDMLEHLREVVSFSSYSDGAMNSPAMYQFSTELGYYGYVTKNVKDLLRSDSYPNTAFAPKNTPLVYSPELIKDLDRWLRTEGNNIIYIYGGLDPWSAPAIESTGTTNALKIVLEGGNHFTFIETLPGKEREKVLSTLERWLNVEIDRTAGR